MATKHVPEPAGEYEKLLLLVAANPRAWLGVGELALYFRLPETLVSSACGGKDSPFVGKSCHPDLFDAWLRAHAGLAGASSIEPKGGSK